jgi:hypothetical protein
LSSNFWPEIAKWQSKSEFLLRAFTWTKKRFFATDHPETWFMDARSYPQSADQEQIGRTLSGIHGKFVLFAIDESGDIPPSILRTAEQGLSTGPLFGKILQAGNPTSHEGMLYASATRLRDQWDIIRITGDPDDPDRSPRIDIEWAKKQIETYGRDNPWIMSYILGQFPSSSINTLLALEEVERATKRTHTIDKFDFSQRRLGVDVARFGDDRTVLFPRQGLMSFKPLEMRGARTQDIAARIADAKSRWESDLEFIDGTGGYGAGVVDSLIQSGLTPYEVNFSGKAIDPRYLNKRAEMWFLMAEWIRRGGAIPDIPQLIKELVAPTYTFQGGKFKLEEKDQIKQRLGFSPDLADALALTFAMPDMPRPRHALLSDANKFVHDFDPYDPAKI